MSKVAVVTGANKGVGLATVRQLCKQFNGDVFLTARNEELGKQAVKSLNNEGLYPKFHQLDITDVDSIQKLCVYLKEHYKGVDILVNNAAICYALDPSCTYPEDCEITMDTNYHGTLKVCQMMFPLLRPGARIVNFSSTSSTEAFRLCNESRRQKLITVSTFADLTAMMNDFVKHSMDGTYVAEGWPEDTVQKGYGIGKTGVNALTAILQAEFDADRSRADIIVNACCPGFVDTDMTFHTGILTPDQGADTALYLALLPPGVTEPKGQFVHGRKVYDWKNGEYNDYEKMLGGNLLSGVVATIKVE